MADQEVPPQGLNFAGAIGDKLTETVKNMDIVSVLHKMLAVAPEDGESEEIRDKLKGVLEQIESMDEEQKETLISQIKEGLVKKLSAKLNDPNLKLPELEEAIKDAVVYKLYMFAAGAILLIILFGTFLYHLDI